MDNKVMGNFIAEMRKEKGFTQKELAQSLYISDKAVSKWERGLSSPDISLLSTLAELLGISVSELLNGKKDEQDVGKDIQIKDVVSYANKTLKNRMETFQRYWFITFTVLLLIAISICMICDIVMNQSLTWSLYPVVSMLFAWIILFPIMKWGIQGIKRSMVLSSLTILPYLYILFVILVQDGYIKDTQLALMVGLRSALSGIVYMWVVYIIIKRYADRIYLCSSLILLCSIPVDIIVSFRSFSSWDLLSTIIVVLISSVLYICDYKKNRVFRIK